MTGLIEDADLGRTLPPREALHVQYEVLLDRAATTEERAWLTAHRPSRMLSSVAETLCSAEFVANAPHHVSRMREGLSGPVCWHIHLPRTGGTRYIRRWQARGGVFVSLHLDQQDDGRAGWAGVAARLGGLREAVAEHRPVLVSGHVALREVHAYMKPPDRIVATIREPVARAVSLYRFARAMCTGTEVVGFPWSREAFRRGMRGWRRRVAVAGLDPHRDFDLKAFLDAGLCPDGQYVASLGLDDHVADLGRFLRDAGVEVVHQESIAEGEPLVNASVSAGGADSTDPDLGWVEGYFLADIEKHAQIVRALPASPAVAEARSAR